MPGKKTELAYLAGILDGEGSIDVRIGARRPSDLTMQIVIGNTHPALIEWLAAHYGGRVTIQRRVSTRDLFLWRLGIRKAAPLLRELLPYLVIKRRQVELLLDLTSLTSQSWGGSGRRVPEENLARRLQLVAAIKADKKGMFLDARA